jgi:hypothetical protein
MAMLLATIASSMIIASTVQYSAGDAATEAAARSKIESPAGQACLQSLKADLESDPRKHMSSVEFRPQDGAAPGEQAVGFTIVMKTRDGVPSRYSGFCTLAPGQAPAVHIKEAESFGRF